MKKTSKKRVAAFALALTMACTSMPVSMETVWAEEIEGTGFYRRKSDRLETG